MESPRLIQPTPKDSRDTWIAAYAAWYRHFLAMQPKQDRLAVDWAHRMVEASLNLHLRNDRKEIRQAALGKLSTSALLARARAQPASLPVEAEISGDITPASL
ncbi:hypothetical protein ACSSZE_16690 [Acidithiobacillus caldus]